jgi:hypothetical protein
LVCGTPKPNVLSVCMHAMAAITPLAASARAERRPAAFLPGSLAYSPSASCARSLSTAYYTFMRAATFSVWSRAHARRGGRSRTLGRPGSNGVQFNTEQGGLGGWPYSERLSARLFAAVDGPVILHFSLHRPPVTDRARETTSTAYLGPSRWRVLFR